MNTYKNISVWRRLASLSYDAIILFCVLMVAAAIAIFAHPKHDVSQLGFLFTLYLVICSGIFLSWNWHKQQTIGMLAWKIKLTDYEGMPISYFIASKRFLLCLIGVCLGGINFWWCILDPNNEYLHDRLCRTRLSFK